MIDMTTVDAHLPATALAGPRTRTRDATTIGRAASWLAARRPAAWAKTKAAAARARQLVLYAGAGGAGTASAWHTFGTGAGLAATCVSLLVFEYVSAPKD